MPQITTDDCKAFLYKQGDLETELCRVCAGIGRSIDVWIRTRKWKDTDKTVLREFANIGVPVVAIVAEGANGLELRRIRGLGPWEKAFEANFQDWFNANDGQDEWEQEFLWPSMRAEDFRFGEAHDADCGYTYFFQPISLPPGEVWDQHTPLDRLMTGLNGGELCESTYGFGGEGARMRDELVARGFVYDRKLDGLSGS